MQSQARHGNRWTSGREEMERSKHILEEESCMVGDEMEKKRCGPGVTHSTGHYETAYTGHCWRPRTERRWPMEESRPNKVKAEEGQRPEGHRQRRTSDKKARKYPVGRTLSSERKIDSYI